MSKVENKKQENKGFIRKYFKETYERFRVMSNLAGDTDYKATIDRIENNIEFKGTNVWILVFAFVVASVGLNVNSPAVIIGAMLISPLMGPIMGIGLSIGINDNTLLRRSLINLFIMMIVSLLASSLYFFVSPLSEPQSELIARTNPTIYDVFIGLFGGLAGITALSRKEEKVTVISGVAIATALMPPLCTAGYGIGTGQMKFFIGALYLFFINAFFIALATFVMVRILKFPKRAYMDAQKEKNVKISIYVFSFLMIVPSVIMAINMVKQSSFDANAIRYLNYIQENVMLDNTYIIKTDKHYSRKESTVSLTTMGDTLSVDQKMELENRMKNFGLKKTKLVVKQMSTESGDISVFQRVIEQNEDRLTKSELQLQYYEHELEKYQKQIYPVSQLMKEGQIYFPELDTFSVANVIYGVSDNTLDTIPTVFLVWKNLSATSNSDKILEWIKVRLSLSKLRVYESVSKKD